MNSRSISRQKTTASPSKLEEPPTTRLSCAKRSSVERKGIHAWHPYYAGYSEAFVDSALDFLKVRPCDLVLDPWGGSGTTGIVASRRGIRSVSIDINPVMANFAAAKSNEVLLKSNIIKDFFNSAIWNGKSATQLLEDENIYSPETEKILHSLFSSISVFDKPCKGSEVPSICTQYGSAVVLQPVAAFCRAVAFVALRKKMNGLRLTNPTWVRKVKDPIYISENDLLDSLKDTANDMLGVLANFYEKSTSTSPLWSLNGNAKSIALESASVDYVITSPPYLTRIDYAVSTLPELHLLGGRDFLREVRHKTTGAPVITSHLKIQSPEWGEICNGVLDSIRKHPTQAAAGYYWKNITQYFMDIDISLDEIRRVLKPGGAALLVVQSSYFKDIEIPLGEIFVQMASEKKLSARIESRSIVKGHMAHKNTKSTIYKNNKIYFEDAVLIEKPYGDC